MSASPSPDQPKYSPAGQPGAKLWLALHFHSLPLAAVDDIETRSRSGADPAEATGGTYLAVYQNVKRTERIVAVSPDAADAGVLVSMTPGEVRVIHPGIRLLPRNLPAERLLLHRLAGMLGELSPEISVHDELTLLMEVGRSLQLFGGATGLLERLDERLRGAPGHHHAAAPTPLAAALCARTGMAIWIDDPRRLRSVLGGIPVECFEAEKKNLRTLAAMGVHVMRDLFRLPGDGLAARFGTGFARRLNELLGSIPHIPPPYRFERSFRASIDLDEESTDLAVIMPAAHRLLAGLEAELVRSDSAVRHLSWTVNAGRPRGRMVIEMPFTAPVWRCGQLEELFRLRLEMAALPAPVRTLSLDSGVFTARSAHDQANIPGLTPAAGNDHGFLDRLRSRLGEKSVRGIRLMADHRPEYAWSTCEPGSTPPARMAGATRPLWLLHEPRPLTLHSGHPCLDGRLELAGSRLRIHCGWWDGNNVFRDYRQAVTRRGRKLWIFREPAAGRWFVHGIY